MAKKKGKGLFFKERTEKQRKGDAGEEKAIARDTFENYEVERTPKNNKGYDYKRKKSKLFWK